MIAVFAEWGIATENLPPNMTDVLHVMDLVVNGPLKAHMRRFRCAALFHYFQSWKLKWVQELSSLQAHASCLPSRRPSPR